jgi:uncharacterized lipoprotein YajG
MNKLLTLIATAFILAACASDPIQIDTINNPPPVFSPAAPAQIETVPVHWTVLTQKQIQELAKKNDPNVVFYALDATNFQNLALNMTEIQRYLQDQKIVILTYKKYYEGLMATPAKPQDKK